MTNEAFAVDNTWQTSAVFVQPSCIGVDKVNDLILPFHSRSVADLFKSTCLIMIDVQDFTYAYVLSLHKHMLRSGSGCEVEGDVCAAGRDDNRHTA